MNDFSSIKGLANSIGIYEYSHRQEFINIEYINNDWRLKICFRYSFPPYFPVRIPHAAIRGHSSFIIQYKSIEVDPPPPQKKKKKKKKT